MNAKCSRRCVSFFNLGAMRFVYRYTLIWTGSNGIDRIEHGILKVYSVFFQILGKKTVPVHTIRVSALCTVRLYFPSC
jgi:hypothetical protein